MLKRRIVSACVIALITLSVFLCVHAETITVTTDKLSEEITISGTVVEAVYSGKISLLVISENNVIAHMANVKTDANGAFTYTFMMGEDVPSGNYTAKVSAYKRSEPLTIPFDEFYVSSARKSQILRHINGEDDVNAENYISDAAALRLYLTDSVMQEIGIAWPKSLTLSQAAKDKMCDKIFTERPYEKLSDLQELFYENVSLYALNEAAAENIVGVWNEYGEYYDTNSVLMNTFFQGYSGENKNAAIKRMAGSPVVTSEDVVKNVDAAVFLQEIYLSRSYSDVNELFRDYGDVVTFDLSYFNRLEPVTRGNALYGRDYKNMAELQAAINLLKPAENSMSSAGSVGGFGGGSWGIKDLGQGEMMPNPVEEKGLKDVETSFWAYEAITQLVEKGVISGYPDNTFLPEKNITREEFITVLVKYLKLDISTGSNFDDVASDRWSYPYISAAYSIGIITGNEENMFNPEDAITRQDMAVIVARALHMNGGNGEPFEDEWMISEYARDGVKALQEAGIINGFEDNTFRPSHNAKRAEAVTIIYKMGKEV